MQSFLHWRLTSSGDSAVGVDEGRRGGVRCGVDESGLIRWLLGAMTKPISTTLN